MMLRSRIDFVRDKERPSVLSGMVLGVGMLCILGTALACAWFKQGLDDAQGALRARQALVAEQQRQVEHAKAQAASRLDHWQDKRWQAALRELNTPWLPVLEALEGAAEPPAYILAMRLDPDRHALELELVAPQFDDALQMVDDLQGRAGVANARLITREAPQTGTPGGGDTRFVLHAAWGQAADDQ